MKATGIVRRIDDLGRVVIPKEIRRTFGIKEGDPLEIFTDDDGYICLYKYNQTQSKEREAQEWLQSHRPSINYACARFTIDGDTTICEAIRQGRRVTGTAKRDPNDTFSPSVGMVYAFCRAVGERLPDNWN